MSDARSSTVSERQVIRSDVVARVFSAKESIFIVVIGLALYLLNGTHAETICTLLTSVPTAIFSYKVLMHPETEKEAFHSVIFFWALYGMSTLSDFLFSEAFGYFLIKFCVLGAAFARSVQLNKKVMAQVFSCQPEEVIEYLHSLKTAIGHVGNTDAPTNAVATGLVTNHSSMSSVYMDQIKPMDLEEEVETDAITAVPFSMESYLEKNAMMSTQDDLSSDLTLPAYCRYQIEEREFEGRLLAGRNGCGDVTESVLSHTEDSTITVKQGYGIVTYPNKELKLVGDDEQTLSMINTSSQNIIWALKSNAPRVAASPVVGMIPSGGKIEIRVMLKEPVKDIGKFKLAVDYAFAGSSTAYDESFLARPDKLCHVIRLICGN